MLDGLSEDLALPLLPGRRKVVPRPGLRSVTGRRVLVTGAGGSIGQELVLQLAGASPGHLVVTDANEFNLYQIEQTLLESGYGNFTALLVNVRDQMAVAAAVTDQRPDIIFHAAALKHVPLLEHPHNTVEAVLTNVIGTYVVATAAIACGASMVLVSSDKAVNPSSIMGLTKRAAELTVLSLQAESKARGICQVRFGNVLGSSGSVVPLFRRQIAQGGPVTVTDERMTRYMMSIGEAVRLVLEASDITMGSEHYGSFVLDMGEPVRIIDLARSLIRQAGLAEAVMPIKVVGIRPGEKLHEELTYEHEVLLATSKQGVRMACGLPNDESYKEVLPNLIAETSRRDGRSVQLLLRTMVPTFTGSWV